MRVRNLLSTRSPNLFGEGGWGRLGASRVKTRWLRVGKPGTGFSMRIMMVRGRGWAEVAADLVLGASGAVGRLQGC